MSSFRLWIYRLITMWLPESRCFGFKNCLLRWAGAKIGVNVRIYSSVTIIGTGSLEIGDDVHIGPKTLLFPSSSAKIKIGKHIDIAPQVMILTGSHEINLIEDSSGHLSGHIAGNGIEKSVEIGDGCWLGARSVILPGVTLQQQTVVAAGAVITHSPQYSYSLVAGIPAQVKKLYKRK